MLIHVSFYAVKGEVEHAEPVLRNALRMNRVGAERCHQLG